MYVPPVSYTTNRTHTTIINETIVYSDTVLSLKEIGANLKVTSIKNVREYNLEKCLEIIFESNSNVIFNTIQYSKNNETVYFYTNQEISIKEYEERKFAKYEPLSSPQAVIKEVNRVLSTKKNKDSDCISLYDVSTVLKKLRNQYENVQEKYETCIEKIIKSNLNEDSEIIIYDFDYKNKYIHISFKMYDFNDYDDIYFSKKHGDLYVVKSTSIYTQEVFNEIGSKLSIMYDELLKYKDYNDIDKGSFLKKTVNSNFEIHIHKYGINIFVYNKSRITFELTLPSDQNTYTYECNSNIIIENLKNKEEEFFKSVFVRIDDCPVWCQDILFKLRQEQLAEESIKESKKQKRLTLTRKIFPFLKKK